MFEHRTDVVDGEALDIYLKPAGRQPPDERGRHLPHAALFADHVDWEAATSSRNHDYRSIRRGRSRHIASAVHRTLSLVDPMNLSVRVPADPTPRQGGACRQARNTREYNYHSGHRTCSASASACFLAFVVFSVKLRQVVSDTSGRYSRSGGAAMTSTIHLSCPEN